ncbi:hydrogenase maturation nickel metallochaperone HypA [Natronosporangium hydrolyticum]|uniref:Hydrogenase maturation factor HypA n=1 Tax=Natronosporangium hydrolyticum TaxID=2811111 RepID=A0A895YE73_9ACTN|nr:hydrogenase maturation nickel metallochaperone HypA [Natronosporangium hydrolyticum]QSB16134.1 hydrogenase maturation nickel metallochaperone HypA [Natronosporangium hydrolyticum]
MHEIGLCEGIVAAVQRRAEGREVTRVRVRAGVLLRVVEPSLAQAFALLAAGTSAADAVVELVQVPAAATCPDCGYNGEVTDSLATCPECFEGGLRLSGGDEIVLESITLASAETAEPTPAKG